MCETYNGWANRETWAVDLWIDNDEGMQESVYELVRVLVDVHEQEQYVGCAIDCYQGGHSQDCESDLDAVGRISPSFVGEQVREWLEDLLDPDNYGGALPAGLVSMLVDIGSLWRVDWREIGKTFLLDAVSA